MEYDCGDSFSLDFEPNQIKFVQNPKENCHHDHIPSILTGNGNIVFSAYGNNQDNINRNGKTLRLKCVQP